MSPSHSVHAAHAYIFSQLTEFQDVSGTWTCIALRSEELQEPMVDMKLSLLKA
jgi:hypothetical protein